MIHPSQRPSRKQRGAALFVSLMMLILLSLLAVSAAQVTGLQERMAGIYRADLTAFEAAETRLRDRERVLLNDANAGNSQACHATDVDPINPADATQKWSSATEAETRIANLGRGNRGFRARGSSQAGMPSTLGDISCAYFSVSAIDHDGATVATSTSTAIVQSVYVP